MTGENTSEKDEGKEEVLGGGYSSNLGMEQRRQGAERQQSRME